MSTTIPLTPTSGGGLCITEEGLQQADLIVSTTHATVSRVIRAGTNSPVSHAMLYAGKGEVIEAIGDGVVRRQIGDGLNAAALAVAYRVSNLTPAVARRVVGFADRWVGRKYDATGAIGGGARANSVLCVVVLGIVGCAAARSGAFNRSERFYCSELVLEAYRRAGTPIVPGSPSLSVPNDIPMAYSHGKLQYVGHLRA